MKHSIEITTKVGCSNVCEYCEEGIDYLERDDEWRRPQRVN